MHERQTPEYWDTLYARGYRPPHPEPFEREMLRNYTTVKSGQLAVDVGCGPGRMAAHMAAWGLTVIGLDFSQVAIASATAEHRAFGDQLTFAVHDVNAHALPPMLKPGSADIVTCRHSLEFLQPGFLDTVRRWLTPTGVLQITTYRSELVPENTAPHRGLTERQIESLRDGWEFMSNWGLDSSGALIGIVLRGPR
ncbi:class I SAM-dependent methyltransferase [Streptomyces sp. NPDC046942]|uniref:class I SAM-dependent methyltransferase n=1 Tax=Streptomyces sp. NPDC046942 TaxID=3155137 RepID=UPI0033C73A35